MAAQDKRRSSRRQRPGVSALPGGGSRRVLDAPVREDHDDVRAGIPRRRDVGAVMPGGEARAAGLSRDRVVGGPDRIVAEQRNTLAGDIEPGRSAGGRIVPTRPDMCDPQLVQVTDRLDDTVRAGIPDVVIADRHDIDPSVLQTRKELRIEGEREPMGVPAE